MDIAKINKVKDRTCLRCGKCCIAIFMPISLEAIQTMNCIRFDKEFILEHWSSITEAEAIRRNPEIPSGAPWYYECDMFDDNTNLCKCYDNRPYVCTNFPYLNVDFKPTVPLYWKGCGYNGE